MKTKLFFLVAFALLICIHSMAQKVPEDTGSKANQSAAQEALDHHNKVRADVGAPALEWSLELAQFAQEWADHLAFDNCNMEHRPHSGQWAQKYGENIFWGSDSLVYKLLDASESWYSEIKEYTYGPLMDENWYRTGHYTQMVWKNTTHVGFGVATCADGGVIVVANYNPSGNYMGEKPY